MGESLDGGILLTDNQQNFGPVNYQERKALYIKQYSHKNTSFLTYNVGSCVHFVLQQGWAKTNDQKTMHLKPCIHM